MSQDSPTAGAACAHCDGSTPHSHVDHGPLIQTYRTQLRIVVIGLATMSVLAVLAVLVFGGPARSALALAALAWFAAIVAGTQVHAVTRRRTQREEVATIAGAIANAALTPLLALAVAALVDAPALASGLCAAAGWMVMGGIASTGEALKVRRRLAEPTQAGEAARAVVAASGGRPGPHIEAAWLLASVFTFGAYVAAVTVLPITVIVLVPLHVAIAMRTRRWWAPTAVSAAS